MAYVNDTGQALIDKYHGEPHIRRLEQELKQLNSRWSDVFMLLDDRQQKLERGIMQLRQYHVRYVV